MPDVERIECDDRYDVECHHDNEDDGLEAEWQVQGEPAEASFTARDGL